MLYHYSHAAAAELHDGQDSLRHHINKGFSSNLFCKKNIKLGDLLWCHDDTCADTIASMPLFVCEGSGPTAGLVFLRSHPESQGARHNPPPLLVISGVSPKNISLFLVTKQPQLHSAKCTLEILQQANSEKHAKVTIFIVSASHCEAHNY